MLATLCLSRLVPSTRNGADHLQGRDGQLGSRAKYSRCPRLVKELVILRWDDSPADEQDVRSPHLLQALGQLRHQSLVAGGERRHPDEVDVAVERLLSDLLRRLE